MSHDKQPWKSQQYLPVFLERILLFQQFMVAFQETFLFVLVQFLEPWA